MYSCCRYSDLCVHMQINGRHWRSSHYIPIVCKKQPQQSSPLESFFLWFSSHFECLQHVTGHMTNQSFKFLLSELCAFHCCAKLYLLGTHQLITCTESACNRLTNRKYGVKEKLYSIALHLAYYQWSIGNSSLDKQETWLCWMHYQFYDSNGFGTQYIHLKVKATILDWKHDTDLQRWYHINYLSFFFSVEKQTYM